MKNKQTNQTIINGKSYSNQDLLKIGNGVASLWGGSCYGVAVLEKEKQVVFECVEHGEYFRTRVDFDKLKDYE